jgi:hypothetical protein
MNAVSDPSPSALGPTTEATSGAWEESTLEALESVPRLSSEQPDHGLVWVTRGRLTVTPARGAPLELPKGSVVAYRLGETLAWTAAAGSHVRWCRREVRVREGEVQPWTPPVKGEEGVAGDLVAPRRRPWLAIASIALLWIVGITVAWCVGTTHSARVEVRSTVKTTPETVAASDEITRLFTAHGFEVRSVMVAPKSKRAFVRVSIPTAAESEALSEPHGPLRPVADAAGEVLRRLGIPQLTVVGLDPSRPGADGRPENAVPWQSQTKILPDGTILPSAPPTKAAPNGTAGR